VAEVKPESLSLSQESKMEPELSRRLRLIYEAAFPPSERDDFGNLVDCIERGEEILFVARLGREAVGLAVASKLAGLDAYLLGYIAVDNRVRGQEIGGRLLDFVVASLSGLGDGAGLIFEAESVEHGSPEESALRKRRIGFYQRHGAVLLENAPNYRGPDLSGPGEIHYALMWIPFRHKEPLPSGQRLRDLVRGLLVQGYRLDASDPFVEDVLKNLVQLA
jgi:ribosomal protein S18 acetylase RimI-like enzyme